MERVLVAVGGNALYDKASGDNINLPMMRDVCRNIVNVRKQGYLPVVTFGNGPQVGNLLDMAETSAKLFSNPVTLDTCVSWTQGEIGYWMAAALMDLFRQEGGELANQLVMAVNTTVEVNPNDPAFQNPTKPVGKFISPEDAKRMYEERGWIIGPDSNRGYRRMVPSPKPLNILEAGAIGGLISQGVIVLCCGGGGIPVYQKGNSLVGIEAVIDKDYTSCLLAKTLKIENLMICTEVDNVYINFGTPEQQPLHRVTIPETEKHIADGQFPPGSMGPKIAAMVDYLKHGGRRAFITSIPMMNDALAGKAGTEFYAEAVVTG